MLIVSPLYELVTSCMTESTVKKAIRVTRAICVGTAAVGIAAVRKVAAPPPHFTTLTTANHPTDLLSAKFDAFI